MKLITFQTLATFGICVLAIGGSALTSAQSVRHDRMDARAARQDIMRLQHDRAHATRNHNWKKVQQDNRLIAEDRHFLRKDARKVRRSDG